jgi:hypothetical protein
MPVGGVPGTCLCYSSEPALIPPLPCTIVAVSSRTAEIERGVDIWEGGASLSSRNNDRAEVEGCCRCVGAEGVGVTLTKVLVDGYDEGAVYNIDGLVILCCGAEGANPSPA